VKPSVVMDNIPSTVLPWKVCNLRSPDPTASSRPLAL
jgi:hypothetical protein